MAFSCGSIHSIERAEEWFTITTSSKTGTGNPDRVILKFDNVTKQEPVSKYLSNPPNRIWYVCRAKRASTAQRRSITRIPAFSGNFWSFRKQCELQMLSHMGLNPSGIKKRFSGSAKGESLCLIKFS